MIVSFAGLSWRLQLSFYVNYRSNGDERSIEWGGGGTTYLDEKTFNYTHDNNDTYGTTYRWGFRKGGGVCVMSDLANLFGFHPRSAPKNKEQLTNRLLSEVLRETRSADLW